MRKNAFYSFLCPMGDFRFFSKHFFYGLGSGLVGNTSWHNWRNTDLLDKKETQLYSHLEWKWPKNRHKFLAEGKLMSLHVGRERISNEREREATENKNKKCEKFSELKNLKQRKTNFHEKTNNITKTTEQKAEEEVFEKKNWQLVKTVRHHKTFYWLRMKRCNVPRCDCCDCSGRWGPGTTPSLRWPAARCRSSRPRSKLVWRTSPFGCSKIPWKKREENC